MQFRMCLLVRIIFRLLRPISIWLRGCDHHRCHCNLRCLHHPWRRYIHLWVDFRLPVCLHSRRIRFKLPNLPNLRDLNWVRCCCQQRHGFFRDILDHSRRYGCAPPAPQALWPPLQKTPLRVLNRDKTLCKRCFILCKLNAITCQFIKQIFPICL